MSFHNLIRQTEQRVSELHAEIHNTYRLSHHSQEDKAKWQEATRRFHEYRSPIDELMDRCYEDDIGSSETLREFAIDFLECDPMFFRSGYFKELLLDKLKGVVLSNGEKDRLRMIMLDAVRRRGHREFRRYCKLAAHINGSKLLERVEALTGDPDPNILSRADMMRRYIKEGCSAA